MYLNSDLYHVAYDDNVFESVQIISGYMSSGGSLSIEVKDGVEQANTIIKLVDQGNNLIGVIRATINIENSSNNESSSNAPIGN